MEIKGNRGLGFSYSPRIEMLFPHDILRITTATACIWGSGSIYLKHTFIFHVWSCVCAPCMSLSNFCHLSCLFTFLFTASPSCIVTFDHTITYLSVHYIRVLYSLKFLVVLI